MTFEDIKKLDDAHVMHTYGRYQVAIDNGKSSTCFSPDGKAYIDFTSGIGVNSFGYSDAGWVNAVFEQASRYQHVCNYYYCEPATELAEFLVKTSGLCNVFFGNSGLSC